jgi:hypothetical protein
MKPKRFLGVCNCPWRVRDAGMVLCDRDEKPCLVKEGASGLFCRWWRADGRPVSGLSQMRLFPR